jgi:hypothetical protein
VEAGAVGSLEPEIALSVNVDFSVTWMIVRVEKVDSDRGMRFAGIFAFVSRYLVVVLPKLHEIEQLIERDRALRERRRECPLR